MSGRENPTRATSGPGGHGMAISSMTGFGRAQGTHGGLTWQIELKSVNGRGLDLRFRIQTPLDGLEQEFRSRAARKLARGNVQISLAVKRESASVHPRVNEALFAELAEIAERLSWTSRLGTVSPGDLLRLPGVVETGESADQTPDEQVQQAVNADFDAALAMLATSRRQEGTALAAIISAQLDQMEARIAAAEACDGARGLAIKARLKSQIEALLDTSDTFDADRLHQEAVLIASRIDVREEIDRLKAHVAQARTLLSAKEPVGRKLDFLAQEFVREANTLCSKANDIALTRVGLDLKTIVEQFREQVQNIE